MTNEEINALSDPQINVMMTANLNHIADYIIGESGNCIYTSSEYGMHVIDVKDYCNDPSAMIEVAFDNWISLIKARNRDIYIAANDDWSVTFESKKPLRAAAIVYLKTKGVL